jgi:hypothetical protein
MIKHSHALRERAPVLTASGLVSARPALVFAFLPGSSRNLAGARACKYLIGRGNLHSCNGCNAAATVRSAYVARLRCGNCRQILIPATLQRLQRSSRASYMRPRAGGRDAQGPLTYAREALQVLQRCKNENMYIYSITYTLQQACNGASATIEKRCRNGNPLVASRGYILPAEKNAIKYALLSRQVRTGGCHVAR